MKNKILLAALVLSFGFFVSSAVRAQVTSTSGAAQAPTNAQLDTTSITFPITELDNCTDRASCRAYCNDVNHMSTCVDWSRAHGLANETETALAKKYINLVQNKQTPGGCTDPESCNQYCQSISHLNECLSFAKENNVSDDNVQEGTQVQNYLATGGKTPGGCDTKGACEAYCKESAHISECIAFAKNSGMLKRMAADQGLPEGQFEQLLQLTQDGQAPGGCTDKASCQKYCEDTSHNSECVAFAEKTGFMSKEEADIVRKTGGVGPGGCKSKDSCETYCNKKENQQSCFDFAKKYDMIPADKLKEMQDGMGRLRSGLDQMPPEAIACLKDNLGQDIVTKIQDGSFAPGPQAGEIIKGCFNKIMPQMQAKLQQGLGQADQKTMQCLQSGLGEGGLDKIKNGEAPTPENGDVLRKCFNNMKAAGMQKLKSGLDKMPPEIKTCITDKLGADTVQKIQNGENVDLGADTGTAIQDCVKAGEGALQQKMQEGLKSASPAIQDCIKSKLGDVSAKMQSGELQGEGDIQKIIQECASNFKPQGIPTGMMPQGGQGGAPDAETLKKLQEQYGGSQPPSGMGIPGGGPTGGSGQSSGGSVPPAGGVPPSGMMPQIDCSQFAAVPSCSYVPAGVAQDACKKCKGE